MNLLLRRLEAYGFKSFADKTEIEFGPGITVVVGPNGSGKSNISDAISWVLGEQSVRHLRGTKMEDVIFAGSSGRRPLGIAEVSLTFDNSDGTLPIEFNEVIITRRVFRSGDSEYFINKGLCRLKDIYELLADTGLGRDAMTVIGQNKVDEILNSKPEDRRLLFEDTAGITKYKHRKKDATRKLEDTTQNLIRVSDITNELETQLVPLAESAERTKKYNEIQSELKRCQVTLLVSLLEKSEKMVESATLQKKHLTEQEVAVSADVTLKETEKIQVAVELQETEERLVFYTNSMNQGDRDLERIRGNIAVLKERLIHSQRSQDRIADEQLRNKKQQHEMGQKISGVQEVLLHKQTLAENLKQNLDEQTVSYENITGQIQDVQQQLEVHKEKTFDYIQELVGERNKIVTAERDIAKLQARQEEFEQEYEEYQQQLHQTTVASNTILAEQQVVKTSLVELQEQQEAYHKKKKVKEEELRQVVQQEKQTQIQVNELNSRFKILSTMQNEYEGFARGIKSVLKSDASWHSGICGAVAQIITVPDQYVTAIEIALGGALQHLITENADIAKQAMHFLKVKNLGRATFLPLDTIKPLKPRDGEKTAASAPGALGFAANLVSCEPRYRPIIESLLGRTIIVENIDIGLKIAKQQGFSVKIVTLGGELLNPGGSMTGGSTNKRDSSFIGRNNAILTITQELDDKKTALGAVQEQVGDLQGELALIEQELVKLQGKRQQTEVRRAEIAVHVEKIKLDVQRLTRGIDTIQAEKASCTVEEEQLKKSLQETQSVISALEKRDGIHQETLSIEQQKHQELQYEKDELQKAITEIKIELTGIEQEITAMVANCQHYEQSKDALEQQLKQLEVENDELTAQALQANEELVQTGNEQAALAEKKIKDENAHKAEYVIKLKILSTLQQLEKDIKELRRKSNELQNRLHESDLLATKYTYEVVNSREKIEQQFSLTIEEAKGLCLDDSISNISKRTRELEGEIAALGPVNHAALDEFTHLKTRYDFLSKQYQDLVSAKEYLASIIADIDKTMSEKFIESFTKINEYFSDIFIKLFGGGSAELKLIDPDNMLSTGIEIIVQPPGKKLQNLVLLSGGERTLTVIALLFAFLTYRPAPFIVVDEIDASLDETNVERLSQFLNDYSKHTQFIVVTHRKGTMEVATVIYGVTMEQSGVSRLISVKLMDKTG